MTEKYSMETHELNTKYVDRGCELLEINCFHKPDEYNNIAIVKAASPRPSRVIGYHLISKDDNETLKEKQND